MVYFAKMLLINSMMKWGEINISQNFSEIYMGGCIKRISHEVFNIHPLPMYEILASYSYDLKYSSTHVNDLYPLKHLLYVVSEQSGGVGW